MAAGFSQSKWSKRENARKTNMEATLSDNLISEVIRHHFGYILSATLSNPGTMWEVIM